MPAERLMDARADLPPDSAAEYCVKCREAGHLCQVIPGDTLCVFCLDDLPCPVMKQNGKNAVAPKRVCGALGCDTPLVAENTTGYCTMHSAAKLGRTSKRPNGTKDRGIQVEEASTAVTKLPTAVPMKEMTMNDEVKICGRDGCGKQLTRANRSGFCTKHFYDSKRAAPRAATKRAAKPRPNGVSLRARASDANGETATVCVSSEQLDGWFSRLTLEQKAAIFQGHIDAGSRGLA